MLSIFNSYHVYVFTQINKGSCPLETSTACQNNPCGYYKECYISDSGNGYECRCPRGLSGDRCDQSDVCAEYPCQNGGTCTAMNGGYA